MKEEWKIIEDTFGKYSVSNLGNVRINEHYTEITPSKVNPLGKAKLYKEQPVELRDQINKKLNDYEVR